MQYPFFLYENESQIVPPTAAELAANRGTLTADGTGALGCAVARNALMNGNVVDVVDGVTSALACCSECQQRGWGAGGRGFANASEASGCTAWNWCNRDGGCTFEGIAANTGDEAYVALKKGQCECAVWPGQSCPAQRLVPGR